MNRVFLRWFKLFRGGHFDEKSHKRKFSNPKSARAKRATEALKGALSACGPPLTECGLIFPQPRYTLNNFQPTVFIHGALSINLSPSKRCSEPSKKTLHAFLFWWGGWLQHGARCIKTHAATPPKGTETGWNGRLRAINYSLMQRQSSERSEKSQSTSRARILGLYLHEYWILSVVASHRV